jgi:hypothetical protein
MTSSNEISNGNPKPAPSAVLVTTCAAMLVAFDPMRTVWHDCLNAVEMRRRWTRELVIEAAVVGAVIEAKSL